MKIKLFLLGLINLFVVMAFVCNAQNVEISWADSLNTAKNIAHLTELQKEVVFEMNKVRTNPQVYAAYLREERTFYNNDGSLVNKPGKISMRTKEGFVAIDGCIKALENAQPVGVLNVNYCLCESAGVLAKDQSKTGLLGHDTSDGKGMQERITQSCNNVSWMGMGENCSYGSNTAREIVLQLLIDDGVPSRGHRENIMKSGFTHCGVFADAHPKYSFVCVIDYATH